MIGLVHNTWVLRNVKDDDKEDEEEDVDNVEGYIMLDTAAAVLPIHAIRNAGSACH